MPKYLLRCVLISRQSRLSWQTRWLLDEYYLGSLLSKMIQEKTEMEHVIFVMPGPYNKAFSPI